MLCYSCKKEKKQDPPATATGTPTPTISNIGDSYMGGITCYLDATGQHGLVVTPTDLSTGIKWYDGPNSQLQTSTTIDYTAYGMGQTNTTDIITHWGTGVYAAYMCDTLTLNGYTDWYLPSRRELYYMISNLYSSGTLASARYWSSTEGGNTASWALDVVSGSESTMSKSSLLHVRAVRSF